MLMRLYVEKRVKPERSKKIINDETNQKRVVVGKFVKKTAGVLMYIEDFLNKFNDLIRRFSFVLKIERSEK